MEVLGELGIDLKLLTAQVINFGILLIILTKFLYKPIIKRIEKDEEQLKQAQEMNQVLKEQQAQLDQKVTMELAEARRKSKKIIQEAEEIAREIRLSAKKETEKEKKAVISQLEKRLEHLDHVKENNANKT